jgi:tripartite-type tricarboxylate transporter receptor subunit TctC
MTRSDHADRNPTSGADGPRAAGRPARRAALRALAATAAVGSVLAAAAPIGALAQAAGNGADFPSRTIRFVVPYASGGPLDQAARVLAEQMRETLGQPVIVENKPGAGGNIGADLIAKAPPDGYSIVMGAVATHAINPYLFKKMPYDANRDFTPITRVALVPNVLVVTPAWAAREGVDSVASLIRYARANPGKLNYGSGGNGSAGHLAGELFKSMAGISMVHIPYKGAAPAKMELISGEIQVMFDNLASATPQIRSGQLKALAVTTPERTEAQPGLPTVAESGVPGFDISTWFGIFAPAGLATPVLDKLYQAAVAALKSPAVVAALDRMGARPAPMDPKAFGDFIKAEQRKYEVIVKQSGATVD